MHDAADRPPRGRDKTAYQPEVQTAPHGQSNDNTKARGYTKDLRDVLENKEDSQDRSTDHGGAPQHVTMTVTPDTINQSPAGLNTIDRIHLKYVRM